MRTIKILSAGPIRSMGMVHGPILTPYTVDDNKLRSLLRENLNIIEILPDNTEQKITLDDLIGTKSSKKEVVEIANTSESSEPEVEESASEETEDSNTEEVSEERTNNTKHNNKKYNKK